MSAVQLISMASTVSFLAGWRLYFVTFVVGLGMRLGWLPMPDQLHALDVLANVWIIGISAVGAVAEFFADKIPWLDSGWDAVHTFVRPVGGALLSMAIVNGSDPAWQVGSLLLGGSAALLAHVGKSGTRTLVNVSPEPYSNVALSTGEDLATVGLLALAINYSGDRDGAPLALTVIGNCRAARHSVRVEQDTLHAVSNAALGAAVEPNRRAHSGTIQCSDRN